MVKKQENNSVSLGIVGFIMSIVGLIGFIVPYFAIFFSIVAIVLGSKQSRINETGLGTASKVIGIVGTVLNGLMLLFIVMYLIFMSSIGGL